jgi:hypothetical protein
MSDTSTTEVVHKDMQWNLILIFLILLLLSIPRQPVSPPGIEPKAEFLIELSWDVNSCSDIDLWFLAASGEKVWYGGKQNGLYSLDRDDLGCRNDMAPTPDGGVAPIRINHEVLSLRGYVAGEYRVNAHVYTWADSGPIQGQIRIIKLNPFSVVVERPITLSVRGQEVVGAAFRIREDGSVAHIGYDFQPITRNAAPSIGGPQ